MMYGLVRQLLFALNTETSHELSLDAIATAERLGLSQCLAPKTDGKPVSVMGLEFPNCVGLAAGLDKNGDCINGMAALGFGFIEIGTVTPRPQPGNPTPRLFRIPPCRAIVNRMGFNNKGVDYLVNQVRQANYQGILGINIGKNFDTPVEDAVNDYIICMDKVYPYAQYITVNISSPNTPGLRDLQLGSSLSQLLQRLKQQQDSLAQQHGHYVPLAVKIAPDIETDTIATIAEELVGQSIDCVIATNTTISREGVEGYQHSEEQGGLSGAPLTSKSTQVIKELHNLLKGEIPIIGVGGIMTAKDAVDKLAAGASLVQIYTGLIYKGPELISHIVRSVR